MSASNQCLHYQDNEAFIEETSLRTLAKRWGTPLYVYSEQMITKAVQQFQSHLSSPAGQMYYSVKANGNVNLLKRLHELGVGFDIVSGGELSRLQAMQIPTDKIVYSGVVKTDDEIYQALKADIHCFNIESAFELAQIEQIATHLQKRAPIACRLNPNVDANTHPHIATGMSNHKFGLEADAALKIYLEAKEKKVFDIIGLSCHIGSQIQNLAPYRDALNSCLAFADQLCSHGITLKHIDIGGGFSIAYNDNSCALDPAQVIPELLAQCQAKGYQLYIEPGRSIVGAAGVLLTQCIGVKQTSTHQFLFVDTGMHHLLRPALYQASHRIWPVTQSDAPLSRYSVVGPICETADTIAHDIELPSCKKGDYLAILDTGAYGMCMASHYNAHPLPAEILVHGKQNRLIRARENISALLAHELHLQSPATS